MLMLVDLVAVMMMISTTSKVHHTSAHSTATLVIGSGLAASFVGFQKERE